MEHPSQQDIPKSIENVTQYQKHSKIEHFGQISRFWGEVSRLVKNRKFSTNRNFCW